MSEESSNHLKKKKSLIQTLSSFWFLKQIIKAYIFLYAT